MSQLSENDRNFLKLWQKLSNEKSKTSSMSENANILRKQGMLIASAENQGLDVRLLLDGIQYEYASIVDFNESRTTLNNYADDILSLAGTKKVASSEWKTSIDAGFLKTTPCFKKLTENRKIRTESKTLTECFEGLSTIPVEIPPLPDIRREKSERQSNSSEPTSASVSQKNHQKAPTFDQRPSQNESKKPSPPSTIRTFPIFETKRKNTSNENDVKMKREKTNCDSVVDCDGGFKTGNEELQIRINQRIYKSAVQQPNLLCNLYGKSSNRSLGGVRQNFKIPISQTESSTPNNSPMQQQPTTLTAAAAASSSSSAAVVVDEEFKGLDPELVTIIQSEILELKSNVSWDSIAGLTSEKIAIKEMVLWPLLRPDLFHGIRAPPKGLLLFGPPGTGKTLIGRCIASQAKATFFNISASSLTSKWVGEGEKLVRTLFDVARRRLPAVIFIDEVDSLLSHRSENEHESSRRIKTEFLQQLDGAKTNSEDRLLLVGATNRPHELDAAARRRFTRRIYIPLPDMPARRDIIARLLNGQKHNLTSDQIEKIAELTENYSCADVSNLCKEAALAPLRLLDNIEDISLDDVPSISFEHFEKAVRVMGSSVSQNDLNVFKSFNDNFGYNNKQ